ncbi:hypothetical protein JW911_00055 [Candidatus Peregrinibacteria bacterium]|nr:hypothetical protein [Candidatus Peregrinibacteria bacterium]
MRYRKKTGTISATGSNTGPGLRGDLQNLHNHNSPLLRTNKGTALIIAVIFIPLLLILSLAFIGPITSSYRAAAADQKRILAQAVAENLYEQAMFETKDLPIGANAQGELQPTDIGYGEAWGRWWVFGQPETDKEHLIDGKYYVPSVGTGDAGGDYCSSANPVYDSNTLKAALAGLDLATNLLSDPADWPCNWGKLKEGQSTEIPLYSYDENGKIHNPGNINFELRVRAACNPSSMTDREDAYTGQICGKSERYVLGGEDEIPGETVIVLWEISGKEGDEDGKDIYLSGYNAGISNPSINSYFNVRAINNYNISCSPNTLCQTSKVKDQDGNYFYSVSYYMPTLYKPTLRLMVIHTLREEITGSKVPYVEYQFRTDAPPTGTPPIANSSKIVKIEVMVDGGYSQTLERTIALPKPITGFVIEQ